MACSNNEPLESLLADLGMELPRNPTEALRKIRDIIQCVICQAVPPRKIFQCENGHLTCESCSGRVTSCPMRCSGAEERPWRGRNLALEQVLAAVRPLKRCRNEGCHVQSHAEELTEHEKRCEHRLVPCPLGEGCAREVPYSEVKEHFEAMHMRTCTNFGCAIRFREDCDEHVKSCEHRTVPCPFHSDCGEIPFNEVLEHREPEFYNVGEMEGGRSEVAWPARDPATDNRDFRVCKYGGEFDDAHFVLQHAVVESRALAWVCFIGDPRLAEMYTARITVGHDGPTKTTHSGMYINILNLSIHFILLLIFL